MNEKQALAILKEPNGSEKLATQAEEAFEIWNKDIGIPAENIFRFGKKDNCWRRKNLLLLPFWCV